jgi:hypothetical protein
MAQLDRHAVRSPGITRSLGTPQRAFHETHQLANRSVDCRIQIGRLVGCGEWLTIFEAGFDEAALVRPAALVGILVAEVHFHARDVSALSTQ